LNKAIVDTCFLEKFNIKGGFSDDDFRMLIEGADLELYIHPYVFDNELDMFSYAQRLVDKGICKKVDYESFIGADYYFEMYKSLYIEIYNEFYERKKISNEFKAMKMHSLEPDTDIINNRYSGSSMGDVHIIMMALFMEIPIILSEDNIDMIEIYDIAKRKINSDRTSLKIYKLGDVIEMAKENGIILGSELRRIRRAYDKHN